MKKSRLFHEVYKNYTIIAKESFDDRESMAKARFSGGWCYASLMVDSLPYKDEEEIPTSNIRALIMGKAKTWKEYVNNGENAPVINDTVLGVIQRLGTSSELQNFWKAKDEEIDVNFWIKQQELALENACKIIETLVKSMEDYQEYVEECRKENLKNF